jgi:hypothetical protein
MRPYSQEFKALMCRNRFVSKALMHRSSFISTGRKQLEDFFSCIHPEAHENILPPAIPFWSG